MIKAVVISGCAFAVGIGTLVLVRHEPGTSLTGSSTLGAVALLSAGWCAVAAGLLMRRRRPLSRCGALLVATGFAWFLTEWNSPGAGSSVVFTVGLVLYTTCPPLAAHAALSYPGGRLHSRAERATLTTAYAASLGLLGLGPALALDPATHGCRQCATNLLAVADHAELAASLERAGVRLGLASTTALIVLVLWQLARSTPAARRVKAPVLVPSVAYLAAVAATYAGGLGRGGLSNDALDRHLWVAQAGALILLAGGVVVERIRVRRARAAVAGMVVELAQAPPPGGLREALSSTLGDPALGIAYPLEGGRVVDASGAAIESRATPGQATTSLVRDGETVAVLLHRSDLLGDARLVEEVASAARLAFENERLEAEARAQLVELRTSRTRLVAASDAERRRLERDLHDGAQQRLVGFALAMRLARSRLGLSADSGLASRFDAVEVELGRALAELRAVASGIHPAVLTDCGLGPAIASLAECGTAVQVHATPAERFTPAAETAAYLIVAEAAKQGAVRATIGCRDRTLLLEVDADREPLGLVDLLDRVAALDGTLEVERTDAGVRIHSEIPCG